MKKLTVILLLILAALPVVAQNFIVKGTIADAKTGEKVPLANAGLYRVEDTMFMRGATTDFDGRFQIADVSSGGYLLIISVVGYEKFSQPVAVLADLDLGALQLRPGTLLNEVQITAEKPLFSMDGEKNIYNTSDDPSIQTGTASDALQNAPGIEVDADGNITLRGTQSVDIWINDRPSHMDGEALKQYIKMLPANSIQKIEVISNPSARYGGGTPVVNIVTTQKVQRNEFFSFGLNGSSRPDQHIWLSEAKPWVSYVFANEKFNFNIYANFGYGKRESEFTSSSLMLSANRDTLRADSLYNKEATTGFNSYIGGHLSYTIDSLNSLGAWYGAFPSFEGEEQAAQCTRFDYVYDPLGNLVNRLNYSYTATESTPMNQRVQGGGYFGGWYEHKFDDTTGHKLNFNLNGHGYHGGNDCIHNIRNYEAYPEYNIERDITMSDAYLNLGAEFEYVRPFGRFDTATHSQVNELDFGIGYDRDYSDRVMHSEWQSMGLVAGKTDSLERDHIVCLNNYSAYLTYLRRFGQLTAKLGLRGEASHQILTINTVSGYDADTTFFTLTPSLHLSYSTPSQHNFSFSFTRRVSRPDVMSLSLYRKYYLDEYGGWGNPDLLPEYSQRIELQWDKYFPQFGSVGAELYYNGSTNQESTLANIIYSDYYGTWVKYTQPMNIGNSYTAGLDLRATYRPTAFINIRFSGSLIYNNEDFTFGGQSYQNAQLTYRLRLNAWAKLWKNYQFFINGRYGNPTRSIFTTQSSYNGVDVGVNADFLDRKMTVNLNIHDIFNLNAWSTSDDNPYLTTSSNWKPMSRYITLGITFRFGKMELAGMAQEGADSGDQTPQR